MKYFLIAFFLCILFQTDAQTEIIRGDSVIWPVGLYCRMGIGVLTSGQRDMLNIPKPDIGTVMIQKLELGYKWRIIDAGFSVKKSIRPMNKMFAGPSSQFSYYYREPTFWKFRSVQADLALNAYIGQTPVFLKGSFGRFSAKFNDYREWFPGKGGVNLLGHQSYTYKGNVWSIATGVYYRYFWTMIDFGNYSYSNWISNKYVYSLSAGAQFPIGKHNRAFVCRPLTPLEKRPRLNMTAGISVLVNYQNGGAAASPMIGLNYWVNPRWSLDTRLSLYWINLGYQDPGLISQTAFDTWPILTRQRMLQLQTQYSVLKMPVWHYNLAGGVDLIKAKSIGPDQDLSLYIPAHTTPGLALGLGISNPIMSVRLMYHYTWSAFPNFWEWSTMINLREPTKKG